jgi:hypothetical protein
VIKIELEAKVEDTWQAALDSPLRNDTVVYSDCPFNSLELTDHYQDANEHRAYAIRNTISLMPCNDCSKSLGGATVKNE